MLRTPFVATVLSALLPGLGQLYNGERAKGIAMLCMVGGMAISAVLFRSVMTAVLLGIIYVAVLIPAVRDAFRVAAGQPGTFTGNRPWYVVWMLLMVGPFALPLLWQSARFSRGAKLGWTVAVILIAVIGILAAGAAGPVLEDLLQQYQTVLP